ncbi:MAG: Glycosyl transferase family 2 [Candidatus Collierbacteria bacterium GW2011_GWC2_44_18]|uniref:Glycosyl transferase family 2 n=2 Tax=Microgenomates group TaxID=1794810 RepID=A0A0G1M5R0_9BACT|nr:MAG: Glycosyl transferase family 2 [Microgenomates group bacterium GW2011_GWC1_44_10]KKT49642.1 MAG: Glycosyl transferase family 2 [Candidatus Collierbacteria bacterium GW2011_GWC2_44_18]KKT67249.1 MAG: Glycosyl transferase family 2 [Candidatus Woesebacteria bacterium GW2011_GWA2_44_33]
MAKIRISAVVNTINESENIFDCLKSLSFCDEIVVVDMDSMDNTKEIAKQFTDRIYDHKAIGYVEPARNFAIKKALGEWILIVDADERVPRTLAAKLIEIADQNEIDFVRISRKNLLFGHWLQHSRWWPDYNVRFFKKGSVEWQDEIHSVPITYGTGVNLEAETGLALEHHHYRTIDEYFLRALRYSNQQSKELINSGYKFDPADLIKKPTGEFLSRFFAGEGYRDGLHGLIVALLQFFSILLIYLKVWQAEGSKPVNERVFTPIWQTGFMEKFKEFRYWFLTSKIQNSKTKTDAFFLKLQRRLLK